uniref:cytoplasmic tRNA 2-thiolation protein 1 n=1 Tax=Euleptes europaea TaxID=460621 RepID=UPI00254207F4|nr:cytoplasmic tRNA 2-thiolation protein 1 [Euleptes europaea]
MAAAARVSCQGCGSGRAALRRPKTGQALCRGCFAAAFEAEAHGAIVAARLFRAGETVAVGASGGKDSTVLAHVLRLLNERHGYGLRLLLLAVDEGIAGYRDDSLAALRRHRARLGLPLHVVSYRELYGWSMDRIARHVGPRNNCTFCGVFRRQALDRGAALLGADKIATGHNADDVAETVLMNFLRGDVGRLQRCAGILTGGEGALPRCKPLKHAYEKEIVLYAYFQGLDYFSTECVYAPNAYRGHARTLLKDLEAVRPSAVADLVHSGERLAVRQDVRMPTQGTCRRCGYLSSQPLCKACVLLEGLNRGLPQLAIGKPGRLQKALTDARKSEGGFQEGSQQDSKATRTIDF